MRCIMRLLAGKVIDGKVVVDGETLEEGETVTILAREGDETFHLDEEQERELLEAIEEADRGELVDAAKFFRDLRARR
jgi:hypothetical protein